MYDSNSNGDFSQADFELLPHERISEVWAVDFQRYFDRWIRYWPRNETTGYYHKLAYETPFFQPKNKKNPERNRCLHDDYLVEQVERHLDTEQWKDRKEAKQFTSVTHSQFWLGLNMPDKTTVSCIDPDAKQYLLGYYRIGENDPLRPVVHLPPDHFRRLKLLYDHFPGRVWCISSATLGMHVWLKYSRPMDSMKVHTATKAALQRLGLPTTLEVHPMPGRCLRRPFGKDYATITRDGLLTTWQSQTTFFEFVAETPPFELIVRTLLAKVREQWRLWQSCGDALKKVHPRTVISEHQHEAEEVERWIEQGCPSSPAIPLPLAKDNDLSRWIDAGCPAPPRQSTTILPAESRAAMAHWIDAVGQDDTIPFPALSPQAAPARHEPIVPPKNRTQTAPTASDSTVACSTFDLESLRNGNWVKGLREIALNGLPSSKSLHPVCYEFAKWLYWVELYKQPDCEKVIYRLLSAFVSQKHNGLCQRINNGGVEAVAKDLKNAINSAIKLHPAYRMESLEIFARVRQKRDQGQYKHVINLAPLLEGDIVVSSPPSPGLLICVSILEAELPKEVHDQITKKAGRNKVMTFATRLINLLHQQQGSCRLHQDKLMELLGYKNKNQATKYVNVLVAAGVVKKGAYRKGKASRLYTLSKDVIGLLNDARLKKDVVA